MYGWAIAAFAAGALCAIDAAGSGQAHGTLYVPKLGDDSDGRSWATAFRTIQRALDSVPEGGGWRIVVRPDVYCEANLRR